MKVKEVIERLSYFPADAEFAVRIYTTTQAYSVAEVQLPNDSYIHSAGRNAVVLDTWLPEGMYTSHRGGAA